jgi:inner membrane transporter RhtA
MPPNGKLSTIRSFGAVPATGLVVLPIFSVQIGAAIAKGLFDQLGPAGMVFLRVGFAALVSFYCGVRL